MNIKMLKAAVAGLALTMSGFSNAGLITTTFGSNNNFAGNMFDLTTFDNSLLITGADLNLNALGSNAVVSLYTRVGSYSGFESSSLGWTLQGQESVLSMGNNNASFFDFTDFVLNANTSYGIYFTVTDYNSSGVHMLYTNGNNSYSNTDLKLDLGVGKGDNDFTGSTINSRTWNGTLYYNTTSVPEPSTIAIFALGIMGLAARRLKKQ
jgi:hypothetical protein